MAESSFTVFHDPKTHEDSDEDVYDETPMDIIETTSLDVTGSPVTTRTTSAITQNVFGESFQKPIRISGYPCPAGSAPFSR